MNCRDFREVADSYLSDELIVETNHEIFQHLETCANCRQELSTRREVREKLRLALKNSTEFQMNPVFAQKLKTNLKDQALRQKSWSGWKVLTPLLTGLLIIAGLTFILLYQAGPNSYAAEISGKAINRHEDCGLKHYDQWMKKIGIAPSEKAVFVKSLQDSETHILGAHECPVGGRRFTHYVLERHGKLISVLTITSENAPPASSNEENSIICKKDHGFQISSFKIGAELVFVISNMSEAENLQIARQLFDSVKASLNLGDGIPDLGFKAERDTFLSITLKNVE